LTRQDAPIAEKESMTVDSVRAFLAEHAPDIAILETEASTATVELAARGHGVQPAQIAKTLSLRIKDRVMLVVASGTARLNNRKIKDALGGKPRMLTADEVVELTGHPVGGVCPFGLATPLPIYCDVSLQAFDEVVPAAGSANSALRINPARMASLVGAEWVDVCDVP
jgi:prolyl-tRNA editing enzyme YbaK/EbsC (Cys-tRNA(Pro) deacylase)